MMRAISQAGIPALSEVAGGFVFNNCCSVSIDRPLGHGLCPGVDHPAADGGALGPVWDQTPAHEPTTSIFAADHCEDVLGGGHVVVGF